MTKPKLSAFESFRMMLINRTAVPASQNRGWFNYLEHALCYPLFLLLTFFSWLALWLKKIGRALLEHIARLFLIREINRLALSVAKQPAVRSLRGGDNKLKLGEEGQVLSSEASSDCFCSWPGLTDKTFNARTLFLYKHSQQLNKEEAQGEKYLQPPDIDALAALFMRPEESAQVDSERSTMLLPFFARWFTDSFMRIDIRDKRKNTSNHDIDLCQIYGLNERDSLALREHRDGRLRSRHINGNTQDEYPDFLFRRLTKTDTVALDPSCSCMKCQSALSLTEVSKRCMCEARAPLHSAANQPELVYVYGDFIVKKQYRPLIDHQLSLTGACCLAAYFKLLFRFVADDRKSDEELVSTMYASGLERGNASAGYTMFSTLFLRQHNRICRLLVEREGFTDDEKIFQTARIINTLILLKLVVVSYVRHIGDLKGSWGFYPESLCKPSTWFRSFTVQRQWFKQNWVSLEFNLLYRWHSLIPASFVVGGQERAMRDLFHNNSALESCGLEAFFEAASRQGSGEICLKNTPAYLFNAEKSSLALVYKNKLPSFNTYRIHFGLKPYKSVVDMCGDATLAQEINHAYGDASQDHIDKVDLYVGLFAEKKMKHKKWEGYKRLITGDKLFGELMYSMVAGDAFSHLYGNPLLCDEVICSEVLTETGMSELASVDCFESLLQRNSNNKRVFASFDLTR